MKNDVILILANAIASQGAEMTTERKHLEEFARLVEGEHWMEAWPLFDLIREILTDDEMNIVKSLFNEGV